VLLFAKNLIFTIFVPGTVAFYFPCTIGRRALAVPSFGLGRILPAAPLLLTGSAIYLWCLWDFATAGRGTPASLDPPRELVVRGLYRIVRNPMYLGVLLVIAGWLALFRILALLEYAAVVGLFFHGFVVLVEEPSLGRRFGAAYEAYCHKVRRWWTGRPRT
jgi:protein-S-isoprenylcysteine O-methyltransferase Ste14